MERFTISLSASLASEFDELLRGKGCQNRSEAVRDMLRDLLKSERIERREAPFCVASLSYVYDHHAGDLAERLTALQHAPHDLVLSSMHVHLDHDDCLETLMLRGAAENVTAFANQRMAEPQVRHGHLKLVPVEMQRYVPHHQHPHVHSRPRN